MVLDQLFELVVVASLLPFKNNDKVVPLLQTATWFQVLETKLVAPVKNMLVHPVTRTLFVVDISKANCVSPAPPVVRLAKMASLTPDVVQ